MTRIVDDTFTEASDTELSLHTPDTGTSWTKREGDDVDVIGATDVAQPTTIGSIAYTCAPSPASESVDEYDVSFTPNDIDFGGGGAAMGVIARWTSVDDWYGAHLAPPGVTAGNMRVVKRVADVDTSLGTRDECATSNCHDGDEFIFKLRTSTSRQEFDKVVGGSLLADDTAITAQGDCGIGWGNAVGLDSAAGSTSNNIDSFYWDDLNGGAASLLPRYGHPIRHLIGR